MVLNAGIYKQKIHLQYLVKNSKNGTGLLIDGRHRAHDDVPESFVKGDTVLSQPAHDVAVNNASAAAVIPSPGDEFD